MQAAQGEYEADLSLSLLSNMDTQALLSFMLLDMSLSTIVLRQAKCIPTEASISSKAPCKRCTQMDLKCEYLARKRRRASPDSGGDGNGSESRQ